MVNETETTPDPAPEVNPSEADSSKAGRPPGRRSSRR